MGTEKLIEGVVVQDLKRILDERGGVMHMLRADSPLFERFGEIYFSLVFPKVVKAWKRHKLMTQHFAVPVGMIKLVIFDGRKDSKSNGLVNVLEIGCDNYKLVKIPPMLCYGFQCISDEPALIANCADIPHDPGELENLAVDDQEIPYHW